MLCNPRAGKLPEAAACVGLLGMLTQLQVNQVDSQLLGRSAGGISTFTRKVVAE